MARSLYLNPKKTPITVNHRDQHAFAFMNDEKMPAYLIVESTAAGHYYDDWYAVPDSLKKKAYELSKKTDTYVDELYAFIEEHNLERTESIDQSLTGSERYEDHYKAWLLVGAPRSNAAMKLFFPEELENEDY